jgi:hypothetical protein
MKNAWFVSIALQISIAAAAGATEASQYEKARQATDPCRPNCSPKIVQETGRKLIQLWQKEGFESLMQDNASLLPAPMKAPHAKKDQEILYPARPPKKEFESLFLRWFQCSPKCSKEFQTEVGQQAIQYWSRNELRIQQLRPKKPKK